jgi:hypothetical protein
MGAHRAIANRSEGLIRTSRNLSIPLSRTTLSTKLLSSSTRELNRLTVGSAMKLALYLLIRGRAICYVRQEHYWTQDRVIRVVE